MGAGRKGVDGTRGDRRFNYLLDAHDYGDVLTPAQNRRRINALRAGHVTMRRLHRKTKCATTGKRRFRTKLDALSAASSLTQARKAREARPYVCPDCKDWHLTSRPGGRS